MSEGLTSAGSAIAEDEVQAYGDGALPPDHRSDVERRRAAEPETGRRVAALVAHLRRDSPDFDAFWRTHDILGREGGPRRFRHPHDGPLSYQQVTLQPAGHEHFKIVMLFPTPET